MKLEEYKYLIKYLNWKLCKIKASAKLKKLVHEENDLDGVTDFQIMQLYWLIIKQTTDAVDHLHVNDICTWIL